VAFGIESFNDMNYQNENIKIIMSGVASERIFALCTMYLVSFPKLQVVSQEKEEEEKIIPRHPPICSSICRTRLAPKNHVI
jgi:predicted Zn-dependent peptidase